MHAFQRTQAAVVPPMLAVLLSAGLAIAGCDRNEAATNGPIEEELGEEEVEGQVIERSLKATGSPDVGEREVEEGEAEVSIRRRVVVRQIEELELPTLRVCEEYADLNQLNAEQLVALGIPPAAARSIVEYREQNGPFTSVDQLSQVQGLDQNVITTLQDAVTVRPGAGQGGQEQPGENEGVQTE